MNKKLLKLSLSVLFVFMLYGLFVLYHKPSNYIHATAERYYEQTMVGGVDVISTDTIIYMDSVQYQPSNSRDHCWVFSPETNEGITVTLCLKGNNVISSSELYSPFEITKGDSVSTGSVDIIVEIEGNASLKLDITPSGSTTPNIKVNDGCKCTISYGSSVVCYIGDISEEINGRTKSKYVMYPSHYPDITLPTSCTESVPVTYRCVRCSKDVTEILPPTGHQWGIPEYSWNGSACIVTAVCSASGCSERITKVFEGIYSMYTPANCSNVEIGYYTLETIDDDFGSLSSVSEAVLGSTLGDHEYDKPIYIWNDFRCTAEAKCKHCDHILSETVYATFQLDTPETCTTNKFGHHHAEFSDPLFTAQDSEPNSVEIQDTACHDYEVSYDWDLMPGSCFALAICKRDSGHTVEEVVRVSYQKDTDATCTTNEFGHYYVEFEDDAFSRQETPVNSVEQPDTLKGHQWGPPEYSWNESRCIVTSTCEADGCTESISKEFEGIYFIDTPATCSRNEFGHYNIDVVDRELGHLLSDSGTVIRYVFVDHELGIPEYFWDFDCCRAEVSCTNCDYYVDEMVKGIYQKDSDATCETNETGHYYALFENPLFSLQETQPDSLNIPNSALGHDYEISYDWDLMPGSCFALAVCKRDCGYIIEEAGLVTYQKDTDATCISAETGHYEVTFSNYVFDSQRTDADSISVGEVDPFNHIHIRIINVVKPSTSMRGYTGDVYCDDCESIVEDGYDIPMLTPDNVKDEIKDLTKKEIDDSLPEEEKQVIEEMNNKVEKAMESIEENTLVEIVDVVNPEINRLQAALESGEMTAEEYEEKIEIVEAVLQSSIVLGSKMDNATEEASAIMEMVPSNSGINLNDYLEEFYKRQYELLLNNDSGNTPVRIGLRSSKTMFGSNLKGSSSGIDYSVDAKTYQGAVEHAETSVEHISQSVLLLRSCSGQAMKQEINNYITAVVYSSFKDFDKEAADREFVENAYKAILLHLQQQVLTSLENEFNAAKDSGKYTGTALTEIEENYNKQVADVNDIEIFEIMILETMRQKYITVLNKRYEDKLINYDEYSLLFAEASDVVTFETKYNEIFTNWALNKEDDSGITLEEVSNSIIGETTKATVTIEPIDGLSYKEIIVFATLSGLLVLILAFAVIYSTISKRKGEN